MARFSQAAITTAASQCGNQHGTRCYRAGHLATGTWTTARTATIRTRIVNVAARLAHRARTIHLHLPEHWPWQAAFENLYTAIRTAPGRPPPTDWNQAARPQATNPALPQHNPARSKPIT